MGNRPNRVRRDGPLLTVGMVWSKNVEVEGKWERHLIRRYWRADREAILFEALTRVSGTLPFCLACLSHNLHLEEEGQPWFWCGDCDTFFMVQTASRVAKLLPPPKPPVPPKPAAPPIPPAAPDHELPPLEDDDYPGDGPE